MIKTPWVVHKFGGTSVASADRYKHVWEILKTGPQTKVAVVVSAMSKVTDGLLEVVELARARNDAYRSKLDALKHRHLETVDALIEIAHARRALREVLETDFRSVEEVLRGVWHSKHASDQNRELISGYGEIWSAQLLSAYINSQGHECKWLDARHVLVVTPGERAVTVDWELSEVKLYEWLALNGEGLVIVTGFVASTHEGIATTLKRNGSDHSASIFGALLKAGEIVIWTDVDGVMTADPRLVPEAIVLDELSYSEATELAYFGAKVVHPSTMEPAIRGNIPVWIKNTFKPELPGTKIHGSAVSDRPVKGFATISRVALFNIEGTGMIGVPGVAEKLFGALRSVGVSVIMISQASSEHSICFAIPSEQAELAKKTVEKTFFAELHHGQIQTVDVADSCAILAIVGDNMVDRPGVAGNFFNALGKAGVNVRAIAQGSSERNISVVIEGADTVKALRASHSAFYLSPQTISIGVIGCGNVGGTLLDQLRDGADRLRADFQIDLRVRGIMRKETMLLDEQPLDLQTWRARIALSERPAHMEQFLAHIKTDYIPHSVLIDMTASEETAKLYPEWLRRGFHVITPNKKANTMSMAFYRELKRASREANRRYLYETTCGAGLPIICTLRDLVQTGDRLVEIAGVFSGTLSFLFNSFDGKRPFSEIVEEAKRAGYTEPDPRDDLSGRDVARKLVILAREAGVDLELENIHVESLVPESLRAVGIDEFMERSREMDEPMARLVEAAREAGEVLRYVGTLELDEFAGPRATVGLRRFKDSHPFAGLGSTDNIVAFTTSRYQPQPLIVQGPGAGPEVTAAGVFSDLLRLASNLGGNL